MIDEYSELVYRVLSSVPIYIINDDHSIVDKNVLWELTKPRNTGTYKGSQEIGMANLVAALNLLIIKAAANHYEGNSHELFMDVLRDLQDKRLIRKSPTQIRKSFKLV